MPAPDAFVLSLLRLCRKDKLESYTSPWPRKPTRQHECSNSAIACLEPRKVFTAAQIKSSICYQYEK